MSGIQKCVYERISVCACVLYKMCVLSWLSTKQDEDIMVLSDSAQECQIQ